MAEIAHYNQIYAENFVRNENEFVDDYVYETVDDFFNTPATISSIFEDSFREMLHRIPNDESIRQINFCNFICRNFCSLVESCLKRQLENYYEDDNFERIVEIFNDQRMSQDFIYHSYPLDLHIRGQVFRFIRPHVFHIENILIKFYNGAMNCDPQIIIWLKRLNLFSTEIRSQCLIQCAKSNHFEFFCNIVDEIRDEENQHGMIMIEYIWANLLVPNIQNEFYNYFFESCNSEVVILSLQAIMDQIASEFNYMEEYIREGLQDFDDDRALSEVWREFVNPEFEDDDERGFGFDYYAYWMRLFTNVYEKILPSIRQSHHNVNPEVSHEIEHNLEQHQNEFSRLLERVEERNQND